MAIMWSPLHQAMSEGRVYVGSTRVAWVDWWSVSDTLMATALNGDYIVAPRHLVRIKSDTGEMFYPGDDGAYRKAQDTAEIERVYG